MKNDMETYRAIFTAIDTNNDGKISSYEMQSALRLLQIELKIECIQAMFELIDRDHDANLNLREFIHFLYICDNAVLNDYKSILFLASDDDYSMTISQKRFQAILQRIHLPMTDQEVSDLFSKEADSDAMMSYEKFLEIVGKLENNLKETLDIGEEHNEEEISEHEDYYSDSVGYTAQKQVTKKFLDDETVVGVEQSKELISITGFQLLDLEIREQDEDSDIF